MDSKKIIVSLDGMTGERALELADVLREAVWGFKINDLVYADPNIIDLLKKKGKVFVDVKLYDIPNTVKNTVTRLAERGANIVTVHASGGIEMMRTAKESAGDTNIIAVTVLTSFQIENTSERVVELAKDSIEAELDGIVCSGHELKVVSAASGMSTKLTIVPGIRPSNYNKRDDQSRVMTAPEAIDHGADLVVVGRPITNADDPYQVLIDMCAE